MVPSVGPYKVLDQLGAGGMGEVCLAEDPRLRRLVALKRLTDNSLADADARARILHEARAVAQLQHSGIATVYDVIEDAGAAWIVMEYVRGETLAARLRRGRIPLAQAADFGLQMAEALAAAHAHGVLHCDLKPSNVLVTPEGKTKLLDFGLARGTASSSSTDDTREVTEVAPASRFAGSPGYLAPERLSRATADERGDIYSLGVILYELVTGQKPFAGTDLISIAASALTSAPTSPSTVDHTVPKPMSDVILKALASNPTMRFQTAADLANAWKSALSDEHPVAVQPRRTNRLWLAASIIAIVASAVSLAVRGGWLPRRAGPPTKNVEALADYTSGQSFLDRRDLPANLDHAIEAFTRALDKDPDFVLAYADLALAYWEKYSETKDTAWTAKAVDACLEALRRDPNQAEVRITLGRIYLGQGRAAEAIVELRRALQIRPKSDDARRLLGDALATSGKTDEALAEYRQAVAIRPESWQNHNALAGFFVAHGQFADAASEYTRVTELQPDSGVGFNNLGVAAMMQGDLKLGLTSFTRAAEIDEKRRPSAYSNIGTIHFWNGDFDLARQAYDKAVALKPANASYHRNLGDALAALNNMPQAGEEYSRALELATAQLKVNPKDVDTLSLAALVEAKLERRRDARAHIDLALALDPRNSSVCYRDATILALAGDAKRALDALKKAVGLGYSRVLAAHDPDLQILRDSPQFAELVRVEGK